MSVEIIIAILSTVGVFAAAIIGAYSAVYLPLREQKRTTAKMIYDDIDRLNWTLQDLTHKIKQNPNNIHYILTSIYPDNGIYYSSRSQIVLLDEKVAPNITMFYTNLQYAEKYRQAINDAIDNKENFDNLSINHEAVLSLLYKQYKDAICNATEIRQNILEELEKTYKILKNPPNRFNRYP